MIKVTIGNEPQKEKEISYPCLMKGESGTIVLFYAYGKGSVVKESNDHRFNEYPSGWNMENFTLLTEPLTIQNV